MTPQPTKPCDRDRLVSRPPSRPLPTPLDPAGPQAKGYPADPKPGPENSPGDPQGKDPTSNDLSRTT
jgi:hypothetical protein